MMIDLSVDTTAVPQCWPTWSDDLVVDNSANANPLFVATDGSAASDTNFTYIVPAGLTAIVANRQPKLDATQFAGHGGLDMGENPAGNGLTVQSVPAALYTGTGTPNTGYPTFVSAVFGSGVTGGPFSVGVEQR